MLSVLLEEQGKMQRRKSVSAARAQQEKLTNKTKQKVRNKGEKKITRVCSGAAQAVDQGVGDTASRALSCVRVKNKSVEMHKLPFDLCGS